MTASSCDIDWARYGIADEPGSDWSMDARHARLVKAVLRRLAPPIAVEVGSHLGVSTLAILESGVPDVRIIDVAITPSVRQMADDYGASLYEEPSETALPKMPPLSEAVVVLDGDHSLPAVRREAEILKGNTPRCWILHDVTGQLMSLGCEGCMWLWHVLQSSGWYCLVDCMSRSPGERTGRGLMIATATVSDHQAVVDAYREVHA